MLGIEKRFKIDLLVEIWKIMSSSPHIVLLATDARGESAVFSTETILLRPPTFLTISTITNPQLTGSLHIAMTTSSHSFPLFTSPKYPYQPFPTFSYAAGVSVKLVIGAKADGSTCESSSSYCF